MATNLSKRLEDLERVVKPEQDPAYVVIDDPDQVEGLQLEGPVKVYIRQPGFGGPDDWDSVP